LSDGGARGKEAEAGGGGGGGGGAPGVPGRRERAVPGVRACRRAPEGVVRRGRAPGHGAFPSLPSDCSFLGAFPVSPPIGGPRRAEAAILARVLGGRAGV